MKNLLLSFVLMNLGLSLAQEVVLLEDFENGISSSWLVVDGDGHTVHPSVQAFQPAWIGLQDPFNLVNKIAGSTSYFVPEAQASRLLITPQISLGAYGNIVSWKSMSHDPSFPDWIMVLISTTGTDIEDFTDTLFRLNNEFPYWTERSINLSDSGYVNQDVYLAFVNHTNQGFKLYLDDIQFEINNPVNVPSFTDSDLVRIYPNPSRDFISFVANKTIQRVEILDCMGRLIMSEEYPIESLNIQFLNPGTYIIRVLVGDAIESIMFNKI